MQVSGRENYVSDFFLKTHNKPKLFNIELFYSRKSTVRLSSQTFFSKFWICFSYYYFQLAIVLVL
jgi:hypothetical protein